MVSNPTELAIAIQYDPLSDARTDRGWPKAPGYAGSERFGESRLENGIPVVERKPLAQVLYKTVDVGDVIPADQYQAVAEVLALCVSATG